MASKNPTSLSELLTIRDILMGEIINEYNDRFEKVEADMKKQMEAQMIALADKEAALDERIKALDKLLHEKTTELSNNFDNKMDESRKSLGSMFLSLGQQLKD